MASKLKQYLTYQHNVQKYFREHCDKYHGVIVPLSIATAFPSGTYGFIRALCAKDKGKEYAIDPRDAMFQKDWDRTSVREPHKKMATVLGGPFASYGLDRALTPEDFEEDAVLDSVVRNCIDFQLRFRLRDEEERKLAKYKKLLGLSSLDNLREPQVLIPPYFQFDKSGDPWYAVSERCIRASEKYKKNIPLRPVLHFARWSTVPKLNDCFGFLSQQKIKSFWLYPNNFREHDAPEADLKLYRSAVVSATASGLESFSLFGGYFAILLSYFGLYGFGNGVGYGEWRDSGYHRGGTAATRIYVLKLHRFLDAPAAQALIDRDPDYFGNDTDILADCLDANRSLNDLHLDECLDHFMECRKIEMDFVGNNTIAEAIAELRATLEHLKPMPLEREKYGRSLEHWIAAIS
jgi:hypothetical protein